MTDTESKRLGFVGTGDIAHAIVTGLMSFALAGHQIWLSPRNAALSKELAESYPNVRVAADNQDVVARSDIVFLAVRPQIAAEVLSTLSFRPEQCAVSVIAGYDAARVRHALLQAPRRIVRALPLMMVARGAMSTVINPMDVEVRDLFELIGGALSVKSEEEFDAMLALSASMGLFFAAAHAQGSWAKKQGVDYGTARSYLMTLFRSLAETALLSDVPLDKLARHYSTVGGLNEQVVTLMQQAGIAEEIDSTYDQVLKRIARIRGAV